MRKQDIKIGEEYAVTSSTDIFSPYSRPERAKVIGPAKEVTYSRYPIRREQRFPVEYADGGLGTVPSREVKMPWAEYAEKKAALDKARNEQADAEHKANVERFKRYKAADDALVLLGSVRLNTYIGLNNIKAAIEAGFEQVEGQRGAIKTALEFNGNYASVSPEAFLAAIEEARSRAGDAIERAAGYDGRVVPGYHRGL